MTAVAPCVGLWGDVPAQVSWDFDRCFEAKSRCFEAECHGLTCWGGWGHAWRRDGARPWPHLLPRTSCAVRMLSPAVRKRHK